MHRHVSIARLGTGLVALIIASTLGLSAILVPEGLRQWRDADRQSRIATAVATMGKALVELSLERSLVQVTLHLPEPVAPRFREMIDRQRRVAGAGFEEALALLRGVGTPEAAGLAREVEGRLAGLTGLRQPADAQLLRPLSERDPAVLARWSAEVPAVITQIENRRATARGAEEAVPAGVALREQVQHLAWAVREYGGRDRTYLAIALALGRSLTAAELSRMEGLDAPTRRRLDALEAMEAHPALDGGLRERLREVREAYRGGYTRLRDSLLAASQAGAPYPVSFEGFFQESSRVLELATALSLAAADANKAHWRDASARVLRETAFVLALTLAALLAAAVLIWFMRRRIIRPAAELARLVERIAQGDLDARGNLLHAPAEVARVAGAVETLRARLLAARAEEARAQAEQAAKLRRQEAMERLANGFSGVIGDLQAGLQRASADMCETAGGMARLASATREAAAAVQAASEAGALGLDDAQMAATRLTDTAQGVTEGVRHVCAQVASAVGQAGDSARIVDELSAAAGEIGAVIATIRSIAEQTNLLALNATIEAARAGEAGKGFSVVAGEVKALAVQTARATEDVAQRIATVQGSTTAAAESFAHMARMVGEVRASAEGIAEGIASQSEAIAAIAERLAEAVRGNTDVLARMRGLAADAQAGGAGAQSVLEVSQQLGERAQALGREVEGFLGALERVGEGRAAA